MKIVALFVSLYLLFGAVTDAQTADSCSKRLYQTFIEDRMDKWGEVIADFERTNTFDTEVKQLELANYYYGYIGYLLGKKRTKDAEVYLKRGEDMMDQIIAKNPKCPEAYAYKGAFLGFRISVDRSIAVILGPRSVFNINKAYDLDKENLQAMIDRANVYFYSPGIVGGDVDKAILLYKKAAALMERTGLSRENWEYFNLLVLLAKAYDQSGEQAEARKVYEKMLAIEPGFLWVKNDLLPDLLKRMK